MNYPECRLCKSPANQTGSHVVSHMLINDLLSEKHGNHRDDGVLFGISSSGDTKHQIGRSVLPEKIEEIFGENNEVINNDTNLTTYDFIFCTKCEKSMAGLEGKAKPILEKLKKEKYRITDNDEIDLMLFFLLQLWRSSEVSLMGFNLDKRSNGIIKRSLFNYLIENSIPELTGVLGVFIIQKSSKTDGLLFLNSGTQSPYYFVFDGFAICYFPKNKPKLILPFYGLENELSKKELLDKKVFVKECDKSLSDAIRFGLNGRLVKIKTKGYSRRVLDVLRKIGVPNSDHAMAERFLHNGLQVLKNYKYWTDAQVIYCVLVANGIMPRDIRIENKVFNSKVPVQ